ncbi:MAG: protein-L-isoaspartate(D-aspartate) O-methyltransferase, partial [FCB group bacterium]|nr:protein-L-isoaspartate(D-aspartate) O-methyltransferase [FCB group bacterium]
IASRKISDTAVLNAMYAVERHQFVPVRYRENAYQDRPLPIGEDQTISQPYIVGLMTQLLRLKREDKVLEIGTGSGYQAAILGELVDSVFTIEIVEVLCKRAEVILDTLGYDNVFVRCGDGYKGWPESAPFDAIIVTCAPEDIPQPLIKQLAEGGKMVIPVGDDYYQELVVLEKKDGKLDRTAIIPVMFVPMTGKAEEEK